MKNFNKVCIRLIISLCVLDNILHHVNTTNSTWPDCVEDGKDFMGDDLLAGLRFSREDCAEWCNSLNS